MANWDDVRRIALALPEVSEGTSYGNAAWKVRKKTFAWERPLREKELRELGEGAPDGEVLGVWVEDLGVKEALIADDCGHFFTTPHFDGYAAVLVKLDEIGTAELRELIAEAWLGKAPVRLAREYEASL
ncbi:MAG TPA: MmcQ/YjbR family DNA-binding protein [Solirubrobacterales bacterium]|nr:MmcQ/YjbR family DNA-binding protein [Solirubrobacterales bacterium]